MQNLKESTKNYKAKPLQHRVFDAICDARQIILQEAQTDSCILTVAMAVQVAAHFGIKLEPLHVITIVFNPFVTANIDRYCGEKKESPTSDMMDHWVHSPEGWSLVLGGGGGNIGHLVAVGEGVLIDASIDQATRPDKQMILTPFWAELNSPLQLEKPFTFLHARCLHLYFKDKHDGSWRNSPDWTDENRTRRAVNWAIARVAVVIVD